MTPAIRTLQQLNIQYETLEYPVKHDGDYGANAAQALGLNPAQVFKTLLVSVDLQSAPIAVALVPVTEQLNLKQFAKTLQVKKIQLAAPHLAQKSTGYLVGGISPIGQKKKLATYLDQSAKQFETIYVSGGQRGLQLCLAPLHLIQACQAQWLG